MMTEQNKLNFPRSCSNCTGGEHGAQSWEYITPNPEVAFTFVEIVREGKPNIGIDLFRCVHCGCVRMMARDPEETK